MFEYLKYNVFKIRNTKFGLGSSVLLEFALFLRMYYSVGVAVASWTGFCTPFTSKISKTNIPFIRHLYMNILNFFLSLFMRFIS